MSKGDHNTVYWLFGLVFVALLATQIHAFGLLSCSERTLSDVSLWDRPRHADFSSDDEDDEAFGPPFPLVGLRLGDTLEAVGEKVDGSEHTIQVERVALQPPIYVFRGILDANDCAALKRAANNMEEAQTVSGSTSIRKNCQVAWLSNDSANGLVGNLATKASRLVLSKKAMSGWGAGYEDMQVVHYTENGEYVLHHDGIERVVTVLYYLSSVGETWFPHAHLDSDDAPRTREEALARAESLAPGKDGLQIRCHPSDTSREEHIFTSSSARSQVSIHAGDAVVFYNLSHDGNDKPCMDWRALHAGMPVRSTKDKWIANHWMHAAKHLFEEMAPDVTSELTNSQAT